MRATWASHAQIAFRGLTEASPIAMDRARLEQFEARIGYRFEQIELLDRALTHSSVKTPDRPSNERLEFLGDAILGFVISEHLFRSFPSQPEGSLTKVKSVVVSASILARCGRQVGADAFLSVGKGVGGGGALPDGLIADAVEAIVAAIYLDGGVDAARTFILTHLETYLADVVRDRHEKNHKSLLQDYAQKSLGATPTYRVVSEVGPDHEKRFSVVAVIGERSFAAGSGASKKLAQQRAARAALAELTGEPVDEERDDDRIDG